MSDEENKVEESAAEEVAAEETVEASAEESASEESEAAPEAEAETTVHYGIEELKELVKFGICTGEAFDKSLSDDGKIGFSDIGKFFEAFKCAPAAFAGISEVPKELKDLDPAEAAELARYVEEELDIANDKVEEAIEKGIAIVTSVYSYIMFFRSGVKKA